MRSKKKQYKSSLESKCAKLLGRAWVYEPIVIPYVQTRRYTPDFVKGDVYIEVKGFFRPGDQSKYLAVKNSLKSNQELVFLFANPYKKVRKGAKMSMGEWAEKHGFRYYSVNEAGEIKWN